MRKSKSWGSGRARACVVPCVCIGAIFAAVACGRTGLEDEELVVGAWDAAVDGSEPAPDAPVSIDATPARDVAMDTALDVAIDTALDVAVDSFVADAPDVVDALDAIVPADAEAGPTCAAWGGLTFSNAYAMGTPNASHGTPVATGDFNHDGHPDIAAVAANVPTVSIYINQGDGTFAPQATYADGAWTEDVVVADFDGDGADDVAVIDGQDACGHACCSTGCNGSVGVLHSLGDGTFAPARYFDSGGRFAESGAAADMNGDHRPDIVVSNLYSGTLAVLLNDGHGDFLAPLVTSTGPTGLEHTIHVADFDGNGTPDVVVSYETLYSATFELFFNDGTGALTPGTLTNVGSLTTDGYDFPAYVTAGDFTGDGRNDLVIADRFDLQILVYANDGTGAFSAPPTITPADGHVWGVVGADFNRDGIVDMGVVGSSSVTLKAWVEVALGTGGGAFGPWTMFIETDPCALASADFNGDGYPDIAAGDTSSIAVYLSQCALAGGGD